MKIAAAVCAFLIFNTSTASAFDRGDAGYICYMKSVGGGVGNVVGLLSLGWLDLPRKPAGCRVRIIDKSSSSYKVELAEYSCDIGVLINGSEWLGKHRVHNSRSDCE